MPSTPCPAARPANGPPRPSPTSGLRTTRSTTAGSLSRFARAIGERVLVGPSPSLATTERPRISAASRSQGTPSYGYTGNADPSAVAAARGDDQRRHDRGQHFDRDQFSIEWQAGRGSSTTRSPQPRSVGARHRHQPRAQGRTILNGTLIEGNTIAVANGPGINSITRDPSQAADAILNTQIVNDMIRASPGDGHLPRRRRLHRALRPLRVSASRSRTTRSWARTGALLEL